MANSKLIMKNLYSLFPAHDIIQATSSPRSFTFCFLTINLSK